MSRCVDTIIVWHAYLVAKHLPYVFRHSANHFLKDKHKGIAVIVAKPTFLEKRVIRQFYTGSPYDFPHILILGAERQKPVCHIVEKRESFHMRKASEEYVSTRILQILQISHEPFHFLCTLLIIVFAKDIINRVVFNLDYHSVFNLQVAVLDDARHNLVLHFSRIVTGLDTIYQLHLEFQKLRVYRLVCKHFLYDSFLFGKQRAHPLTHCKHKSHKSPLPYFKERSLTTDVSHDAELCYVEGPESCYCHCRNDKLLVLAVNSRSSE